MGKTTATLGIGIDLKSGTKSNAKAVQKGIGGIVKELQRFATTAIKANKIQLGSMFGNWADGIASANSSLKNLASSSKKAGDGVRKAVEPFEDMSSQIKGVQGVWEHYQKVSNKTVESTKKNAQYTRNLSDSLSGLAKQITDAGGNGDAWLKRIKASNLVRARENKLIDDSGRVIRDMTKAQMKSIGISEKTQEAYIKSRKQQSLYDQQVGKAIYKTEKYQKAVQTLGRQFQWTDKTTAKWAPKLKAADSALTALSMSSKNMSKSAKAMVSGLKLSDVALASLGKNVKVTGDGIKILNRGGMNDLKISSQATAKELGILSKSFKMVSDSAPAKAIRKITSEFPEAVRASSKLREELRNMHRGFKTAGDGGGVLTKNVRGFAKEVQKSLKPMSLFERGLKSIGSSIKSFASYAAGASIIAGIAMTIRSATTAIIDFDQSLKDLQAITGATDREVGVMGDKILDVASKTKFSAQEVALGMKTLGQAGLTASESVQTMQAVSDLATGTLTEMGVSVDLVTTAMRVFDISASDSGHVADVFANAVNRSKLTVEKLRIAMNYVGPVAKRAGVSFEEVASSMMVLANSGIRASTIGTGLRQVFRKLVDPSKKLSEGIKKAGMSIDDFNPQLHSMHDIIENLSTVVVTAEDAFQMFGMRGASAISALTDKGSSGFDDMHRAVTRSGAAAEMAKIQMEGLGVKIKNMWDLTKNLAIALGDTGLSWIMHKVVDVSRKILIVFTALAKNSIVVLIMQVTALTAAFVVLIALFKTIAGFNIAKVFGANLASSFGILTGHIAKLVVGLKAYILTTTQVQLTTNNLIVVLYKAAVAWIAAGGPVVWITGILIAFTAAIASSIIWQKRQNRIMQESIDTSLNLVDTYTDLATSLYRYREKVIKAGEDTVKVNGINLEFRDSLQALIKTGEDATEAEIALAESAQLLSEAIDPLTGHIEENSEALIRYRETLQTLKIEEMANSLHLVSVKFEKTAGVLERLWNRLKTLGNLIVIFTKKWNILSVMIKSSLAIFNGAKNALGSIFDKLFDKFPKIGKLFSSLSNKIDSIIDKANTIAGTPSEKGDRLKDKYLDKEIDFKTLYDTVLAAPGDQLIELRKDLLAVRKVSNDTIDTLMGLNKVDMGKTSDQLEQAAKDAGYLKEATRTEIAMLKLLWKERQKSASTSAVGRAEVAAKRLAKKNKLQQKYSVQNIKYNQDISDSIKSLDSEKVKAFDADLERNAQAARQNKADFLAGKKTVIEYKEQKEELNKVQTALDKKRMADSDLSKKYELEKVRSLFNEKIALIKNKEDHAQITRAEAIEAEIKAQEEKSKKIRDIMTGVYDVDALKSQMKEYVAAEEQALVETLRNIELASVSDKKGTDEGIYEQQKLEAISESHRKIEEEYRVHYQNLLISKGEDDTQVQAWHKKYLEAIEARQKSELNLLKKFAKDRDKAEEKVASLTGKRTEELSKHSTKWKAIEADTAAKIVAINASKEQKIKTLLEKRADVIKKANSDIIGIHQSTEDKIANINQRGMTDRQKDRDNEKRAWKKLAKGKEQLRQAIASGDKDLAQRAKSTIEDAGGLYESLSNDKKAINGLKRVENALVDASSRIKDIDVKEIDKDIAKEKTKAKWKIKLINDLAAKKMKVEFNRHTLEMKNLDKEIAKWNEKLITAKKLLNLAKTQTMKDVVPEDISMRKDQNVPEATKAVDPYKDEKGVWRNELVGAELEKAEKLKEAWDEASTAAEEHGKTVGGMADMYAAELLEDIDILRYKIENGDKVDIPLELTNIEAIREDYEKFSNAVKADPLGIETESMQEEIQGIYTDFVSFISSQDPVDISAKIDQASLAAADVAIKQLAQTVVVKVKTSQSKEKGGEVRAVSRVAGGRIPGPDSKKDNTLVHARSGEWFIKNESVSIWKDKIGSWFMNAVNAPMSSTGKALQGILTGAKDTKLPQASPGSVNLTNPNSNAKINEISEYGVMKFDFPNSERQISALMKPTDVSEMIGQLNKLGRLAS